MGLKHQIVMFRNRFPGAKVSSNGQGVYAHSLDGELLCAVERDGLGRLVDASADHGAKFQMSQDPIPRNARVWKLSREGKIEKDEESDGRQKIAKWLSSKFDGRVPSISELRKAGYKLKEEFGAPHRAEVLMPEPQAPAQAA